MVKMSISLKSKKITERATKITINEKEVELDYGEIKRVIDKKITIEQQSKIH